LLLRTVQGRTKGLLTVRTLPDVAQAGFLRECGMNL
jgi:hypothetical protein